MTPTTNKSFESFSITKSYFNTITRKDCSCASVSAKISAIAFPVIALLTLLADLIASLRNCLCGRSITKELDPTTIPLPEDEEKAFLELANLSIVPSTWQIATANSVVSLADIVEEQTETSPQEATPRKGKKTTPPKGQKMSLAEFQTRV